MVQGSTKGLKVTSTNSPLNYTMIYMLTISDWYTMSLEARTRRRLCVCVHVHKYCVLSCVVCVCVCVCVHVCVCMHASSYIREIGITK